MQSAVVAPPAVYYANKSTDDSRARTHTYSTHDTNNNFQRIYGYQAAARETINTDKIVCYVRVSVSARNKYGARY